MTEGIPWDIIRDIILVTVPVAITACITIYITKKNFENELMKVKKEQFFQKKMELAESLMAELRFIHDEVPSKYEWALKVDDLIKKIEEKEISEQDYSDIVDLLFEEGEERDVRDFIDVLRTGQEDPIVPLTFITSKVMRQWNAQWENIRCRTFGVYFYFQKEDGDIINDGFAKYYEKAQELLPDEEYTEEHRDSILGELNEMHNTIYNQLSKMIKDAMKEE